MINILDRFDIRWIGRCQYGEVDKIWGWFFYTNGISDKQHRPTSFGEMAYAYAFWGSIGKSINLKTHIYNKRTLEGMVNKKKDRCYVEMTKGDLMIAWKDVGEVINEKFMFHILASST